MRILRRSSLLALILSAASLISACNFSLAADVTPPPGYRPQQVAQSTVAPPSSPLYPLVPPDPSKGEAIYLEKCAPCHGESGLGDGPEAASLPNPVAPLGTNEVARQAIPADWFNTVTQGNLERFMPPFRSLSDRQRWDVVAYAISLSTPRQEILQGAELYQANCARCHGERGEGDGPDAADMKIRRFTDQQYMANKSAMDLFGVISAGSTPDMPAYGNELAESERWALASFLRTLTFAAETAGAPATQAAESEASAARATPGFEPASSVTETLALGDSSGTITGFIMNGSGGEVPAGLEVNLHAFDQSHGQMSLVFSDTVKLAEDGSYTFTNVEMLEGRSFFTSVEYKGAVYGSELGVAEAGQTELELPIQVFETSTDTSVLSVDRVHFFFEFLDPETLRVVELYVISNPTDQTLIGTGEGAPVVSFTLPPDASNLEFEDGVLGGRYISIDGGFADTAAVRPGMGDYQVLFSYTLPYNKKLDLSRPVAMRTDAIVVLTPQDGINIKGSNIQDAGTRDVQGTQYHMYTGGNLNPGDTLTLSISGKPGSSSPTLSTGSNNGLLVGVGALGLVLIVAGIWLYRRNRTDDETDAEEEPEQLSGGQGAETPESLMDAILALDDLYQEGQLPEEAYTQRRTELKERLKAEMGK